MLTCIEQGRRGQVIKNALLSSGGRQRGRRGARIGEAIEYRWGDDIGNPFLG